MGAGGGGDRDSSRGIVVERFIIIIAFEYLNNK